ncbi:MAG TPA: DUF3833 family protein [Sphingomicrobium sp.]|nr:DUF3833 family protein [Sphingomicrobium sp.]
MIVPRLTLAGAALMLGAPLASAQQPQADPMRFFVGRTETHGTIKVIFKKAYRTSSVGEGRIQSDGSLMLVQRVTDDGQPPHERRWRVRETGPGEYAATMSEATSPVVIDRSGGDYRFRFTMKGNLNVEEWLTPLPGDRSASTVTKVRRFGMTVATAQSVIRKI